MKLKTFITVFITVLVVITLILTVFPLAREMVIREKGISNPRQKGAEYVYCFLDLANEIECSKQSSVKTNNFSLQGGFTVKVVKGGLEVRGLSKLEIECTTYYNTSFNEYYQFNNTFSTTIINPATFQTGGIVNVGGGLYGKDVGNVNCSFSPSLNAGNISILQNFSAIDGTTVPVKVNLKNFNEEGIKGERELYKYDSAGAYHVLTCMCVGGNSSFISDLMPSNVHTIRSFDFVARLIATNVEIGPLNYWSYISVYLPFVVVIWLFSAVFLYFILNRFKNKKGIVHK